MSPTSHLAAPSRANYKGGCGIRTHARFYTPDGFQDRSLQPDLGNPGTRTYDRSVMSRVLPVELKVQRNPYISRREVLGYIPDKMHPRGVEPLTA